MKVNPVLRMAIIKQFDKHYDDKARSSATNRTHLEQRSVLAPFHDNEKAQSLGTERDKRLKIDRKLDALKKGKGNEIGTGS